MLAVRRRSWDHQPNMRAIVLHETGPAENLKLEEIGMPASSAGHVLVRVRAAGVCGRDVIDRRGGFPFMKIPVVPGHEFAGEVVSVGEGVSAFEVGARVANIHRAPCGMCDYCQRGHEPRCTQSVALFGLTVDGGYAEHVLAAESSLVALPDTVPFHEGCFLACTAGVALRGLATRGQLKPGERVLITGASGGVGMHAIQVATALGAKQVIAVTSSGSKVAALEALGAHVVVSSDLKFHRQVKALSDGGVDVVLDGVGAPTLNASIRSVRPMGRVVVVGNVTVARHEVNPGYLILNEVCLTGTSSCTRDDLRTVLSWVEQGTLRPVVAARLPLAHAAQAHRQLEAKNVTGRLVLEP